MHVCTEWHVEGMLGDRIAQVCMYFVYRERYMHVCVYTEIYAYVYVCMQYTTCMCTEIYAHMYRIPHGRHARRLGSSDLHICMYTEICAYMYSMAHIWMSLVTGLFGQAVCLACSKNILRPAKIHSGENRGIWLWKLVKFGF